MNKIFTVCIAALVFAACNPTNESIEKVDYNVGADTVTIADGSPILRKLITQKVKTRSYSFDLTTSGTVNAIPNNYALIAAPFAGRVTKCFVRLGQEVNAGTPVFEISSPAYFETGKAYYQTKEEMDLASKFLKRQKDLLNKGVGVQKDLEEAQVCYAIKTQNFENAVASLKVFQVDTSSLVLGQPLIVRSPIKGTIVENTIVIGQYIKDDSDPVATVAELSKVWVAGQVKEKDIRYISDTAEVGITLISFPEKNIKGKIYHINSIIDEDTRSVQVLIACDNKEKIMKPGMYVTAKFAHIIEKAIVVPLKAIFQRDDVSYVFVHLAGNKYLKQRIETITEDKDSAIVKSGLNTGDEIIVDGGFYLLEEK
ncbi:efflux RND transporter periplasmic adaptor subunit [Williamwhitmania taraxaci]|uniref:Membrane fusion protein, cobalt-zinc-cadmium efflux system n=1 Tax=Williamwhitmania taraxaci TaxID=1640674 RepID=A0A1G6MHM9_9BACT|nr:efflux RND transporter periplasmic adaptor subunit [Williamwhitmania taraxaci]SDC54774.1 membrane fusion protein, cobalt-zinc-cadmium efflux system [Williamwhitmania taraxaci]